MNGIEAQSGDWAWTVSINGRRGHDCGGILINEQYVLTAAHCFKSSTLELGQTFSIGVHNLKSKETWVQTRYGQKLFIHEKYDPILFWNDVALVKLWDPVDFNDYIVPACIDETGTIDVSDKVAWITGWGAQFDGGSNSPVKNQVSVNMLSADSCEKQVEGVEFIEDKFNREYNICGGTKDGNSGACFGDSGGPLVYKNPSDGLWYAVGLVSWGPFECGKGTVFAKISNYISWIKKKIALN